MPQYDGEAIRMINLNSSELEAKPGSPLAAQGTI